MTALERRLIAVGFGVLLVFALPLVGDDLAGWLLWPFLIAGAVLLDRVPIEGSPTSSACGMMRDGAGPPRSSPKPSGP